VVDHVVHAAMADVGERHAEYPLRRRVHERDASDVVAQQQPDGGRLGDGMQLAAQHLA
jgi:hypothetical protein